MVFSPALPLFLPFEQIRSYWNVLEMDFVLWELSFMQGSAPCFATLALHELNIRPLKNINTGVLSLFFSHQKTTVSVPTLRDSLRELLVFVTTQLLLLSRLQHTSLHASVTWNDDE